MKLSPQTFRVLGLCTQRPGAAVVQSRLPAALAAVASFRELVDAAVDHGVEPLLTAHLRSLGLGAGSGVADRLRARALQHGHAAAVRMRVLGEAAGELECTGVPVLVLKGAALAQLVYADPRLRPMRDVDLLVRARDVRRAVQALGRCGFSPADAPVPPGHHHLPAVRRIDQGVTITIEVHHGLLAPTPLIAPAGYDDLAPSSQEFECGGRKYRTLGCEDMLWHVYAHAFVINTLRPGAVRLISVADLVHATEAWIDRLDWTALRRRYPRLIGALSVLPGLVPWSQSAEAVLRSAGARTTAAIAARPMDDDIVLSPALVPGVLWPAEWWFRMRYGVSRLPSWVWYRTGGHPARLALSAARAVAVRINRRGTSDLQAP